MSKKDYNHQYYLDHKPKKLQSVKPRILDLDGRELNEALEKIIAESPSRYGTSFTENEDLIIQKLYGKAKEKAIASAINKTTNQVSARISTLKEKGILKSYR